MRILEQVSIVLIVQILCGGMVDNCDVTPEINICMLLGNIQRYLKFCYPLLILSQWAINLKLFYFLGQGGRVGAMSLTWSAC